MTTIRPKFMNSSYFVDEPGNWHLKKGAPLELEEEFNRYLHSLELQNASGTMNGIHIEYPYNR